ncbi:MAG: porin [Bacteroidetes bacterium]|nr:porin [Bacteroidota bacterium]
MRLSKNLLRVLLAGIMVLFGCTIYGQGGSPTYQDGMTVQLDSTGKKYIRFLIWSDFMARYTRLNPGTAVNGVASDGMFDFSVRQFRFAVYTQLSPRYLILATVGMDNQTFSSGGTAGGGNTGNGGATFAGTLGKKPDIYVHELWNEFTIFPDNDFKTKRPNFASLYIGTGLHYWVGISRMSSLSSFNFLAVDAPLYNWPLIDNSDQLGRQVGVYIKGKIGPVPYRWAINKPFTVINPPVAYAPNAPEINYAVDNNAEGKLSTTGYASWDIFEQENSLVPYTTGTYVGTRKVLNIGAGYYYSADATSTQANNTSTSPFIKHNIAIWATDIFADLPFGGPQENWAVTAYSVYYHDDFGPNYLRNGSIINENVGPAKNYQGTVSQAGFGNLAPIIGTGSSWFTQAGLLLPKTLLKTGAVRLQPFAEYSLQQFERYGNSKFTWWSAGGNVYLDGHHARISFKYQTRPIVTENRQSSSKGTFVLSTQVFL